MANKKLEFITYWGAHGAVNFTTHGTPASAIVAWGKDYKKPLAAFDLDKFRKNPRGTSTRTEVRSPTRTSTSTKAYTRGNVTVTGGAGAGNTSVTLRRNPHRAPSRSVLAAHARGVKARKATKAKGRRALRLKKANTYINAVLRRNPAAKTRIAVQAELAKGLWATISTYPNTEAGKHAAIESAKKIHNKVPAQGMRVIRVKR